MSTVVLFHSALGLNPGLREMAERLRTAGHTVHTPDYYSGHVFTDTAAGIAYRDEATFPELARRAAAEVEALLADVPERSVVFGGFSLGAAMAQSMGKRNPKAAGALLFHAGGAPKATSWPAEVPLQIHHSVDDPWVESSQVATLVDSVAGAGAQASHFVYPGSGHLFADPTTPDYDAALAELMWGRVLRFLDAEV
ncbi:dienelactone hydrolase family protein [Brevibacterium sp. 50QC2O2]|jgi:dienelactone hydrolase|uniref:dienelactone hydrolase family protein n=1 Tax=Brevibacterium TaxID=1696 RepID=UPI00211CCE38|nr:MULTISPECIES: dienelactone hydrolase family protein [unclassified Brevibacterium]MCQ9368011.1 dienelactone hydrolase family protein [Brevibacterium sp. 91QC2O2]MCQ9385213.1 dienelactone hydrolase family protein [Brevibacterium sp. 68QC2CO]MCQ9388719.1 dienelactone hydrolase family protein [Brevibacterium sp. 50QC2O2]